MVHHILYLSMSLFFIAEFRNFHESEVFSILGARWLKLREKEGTEQGKNFNLLKSKGLMTFWWLLTYRTNGRELRVNFWGSPSGRSVDYMFAIKLELKGCGWYMVLKIPGFFLHPHINTPLINEIEIKLFVFFIYFHSWYAYKIKKYLLYP